MSIIYDALQKTQRSREYLKLQTAITPSVPHRRNIKWMVLGGLTLVLTAGLGGVITFYWPSIKIERKVASPVAVQQSAAINAEAATPVSEHLSVTDATPSLDSKSAVNKALTSSENKVLAQASPSLPSSSPSAKMGANLQQEITTVLNTGKFNLNGVMISGSERVVLINNQSFHVGDIIEGMKIVSIEFNSIKMQKDQKILEMKVPV